MSSTGEPAPAMPLSGAVGFRALLEAMPDALVGVDRAGVIRLVNHRAEALFGYDRDAMVGQLVETLVPRSFRTVHAKLRAEHLAGPSAGYMRSEPKFVGVRRDGSELPVEISLSNIQTQDGLMVIAAVRDMTVRRDSEEARRQADRLLAAIEFSGDAILTWILGGVITSWNRAAEALFGYPRQEIIGRPVSLLIPLDRIDDARALRARIEAGSPVEKLETIGLRKDGTVFPISLTVSPVRDSDNSIVGATAIARDVTELNQTFAAAQRMAAIVADSDDAILSATLDGVLTSWNPAAERMYGYTSEEMIGRSNELLSPVGETDVIRRILDRIRAGQHVERQDVVRVRKDGTTLTVSMSVSPIHDLDGRIVGVSVIARDVTEARLAFGAARSMIESSLDSMVAISPEGRITDVNGAAVKVTGIPRDALIGTAFSDCFTEPEKAKAIYELVFTQGMAVDYPLTMRHTDGTLTEVLYNASVYRDSAGNARGVFAAARDVTELNRAAQIARSLVAAEDLVRTVMASATIGIALTDSDGSFRVVNRALCDLLGYDEAWFLAHRLHDMVYPADLRTVLQGEASSFDGSLNTPAVIVRVSRADHATVWTRWVTVLVHQADGDPDLLMVQVEDITAEHDAQEALAYQTLHDPLTGLHNRAWILDILKGDLQTAERAGTAVGVLFVGLDNFKVVNDSLGHAAGDEVLTTVAHRIEGALRSEDRAGRFGGDELVVVVQDVHDVLDVEHFAERLSAVIAADLQVQGHRIVPTASIGIALSTPTSTPESLLRDTESAMFRAKAAGRARWQFFDDTMHAQAVARLVIEDQLRDAITAEEFVVYYQPIVALADSHIVGHEALVRWAHPTRGLLSPGEFLDIAEDSGLITAVGAQVLDQACAMLAARPDLPGPISVNVSAVQLSSADWLDSVTTTLATHRVDPARLVIEITETAALSMTDSALLALECLRGLGVGIHLDDFGTGYSSISVLRDVPVTGVKLDLSFVRGLTPGKSQANELAHGLSVLVNGMHLTSIAEGIETQLQARILGQQGWECGQGYYFGRPAAIPLSGQPIGGHLIR
jgi:diguanylate cyclase (GGDEF)-like protein/PAS domain S-box-containing protein